MALVVKGRVFPISDDPSVAAEDQDAFAGRVWIGDDGLVAAVTRGRAAGPAHLRSAPTVDVGDDLVMPGLIDLHNHLAYNTLPLWAEPSRKDPWLHHNSWPAAASYASKVTWPAYALITAAPDALLAYVETKAVVGGTTTIQGSPPKNRPRDGWLVRNAEDEKFGTTDADLVYASVLTVDATTLARRANAMRDGATFIYHCAEGSPGTIVGREFTTAAAAGCLQPTFVAVHATALQAADFQRWHGRGSVVWSPLSNLWLYGVTTDVPAAIAADVRVCLGSDWAPSGSKNVLGELKVARAVSDDQQWDLSDADLVRMVTANPGDALGRSWPHRTGRLQPGALGDVLVLSAKRGADPAATVVAATERDVRLVVIAGEPKYGTQELMRAAGATRTTSLDVQGSQRILALARPGDPTTAWQWDDVLDELEAVRADPRHAVEDARNGLRAWAGRLSDPAAPLRLALDMPRGEGPVGGLPKDLSLLEIPALDSLAHDDSFIAALHGRGFHHGVLDRLADCYA